jgi:hypothetical protein
MTGIFDRDGNEIAQIEISHKQQAVLDTGEEIVVIYHTPQLLRHIIGEKSGTFVLRKMGLLVVAQDVAGIKRYAALQVAIKKAREAA